MNDMNSPVIHALIITAEGVANEHSKKTVPSSLSNKGGFVWIHLDARRAETRNWLTENGYSLDPLVVDALLAENTRPRMEEYEEGALVILRGVNMNDQADPEDMIALRMWCAPHCVITLQRRPLKAVKDLADKVHQNASVKNAGDLLVQLSGNLFLNMEPFVTTLGEELDDIEEELTHTANAEMRGTLRDLRTRAIIYRRYFAPQKDVMARMRSSDVKWLDVKHKRILQEHQDRLTRYIEDLDALRERAQIIKDELANALSDKLNRNLYVLSLVTAIFLPLSFMTGLLGINVGGMPGASAENAFWLVVGLCAGLGLIQIAILKLLKWL